MLLLFFFSGGAVWSCIWALLCHPREYAPADAMKAKPKMQMTERLLMRL
jgi:hypothetical protein